MNSATINRKDLKSHLLEIIRSGDKTLMDNITDQIFSEIEQLDKNDHLYGLSIALTNFYFETFWFASIIDIQERKTKKAEENILWSCQNAWKQEAVKNYTFHKGTPYFFLGFCYLINGNLDLAFQMIHNGHVEGLNVYHRLGLDYKIAPSYLFMTMNANDRRNAMYDYVQNMKKKMEGFIGDHNMLSSSTISYEVFDKKFLQRMNKDFDEIKFVLVYLLMSLINLDSHNKKFLTDNSFSNLRKIELMRSLSLIVDKTLAEKHGTEYISDGVIQYLVQQMGIAENDKTKLQKALTYSDGSQFLIKDDAERIFNEILANGLRYSGHELSYPMKCMIMVWRVRNYSAHNLSGINQLLGSSYHAILSMLFSALFFAAEIL